MAKINYKSTRDDTNEVTASQAILQGLATDGGLYVPTEIPKLSIDYTKLAKMSYQEVAYFVMSQFFTDFTEEELKSCIEKAYDAKFDNLKIAPLKKVGTEYYLELFHGSTIAFKDMALSILPYLMITSAKKNQSTKEIVILTATSGDTGKAAMAGFSDVPNTKIIVFYPKNGVSPIQERQMVTQRGKNTYVVGIEGNFDVAQTNVKAMFNNVKLKEKMKQKNYQFSSANSINIGRLIPQIVYYYYAYGQLLDQGLIQAGEPTNFTVPTGNFGNILAGYYAKKAGLPIQKLLCASNKNKVLTDFFKTGIYDRNRPFYVTSSPSMDILISSNLERLLYHATGNSAEQTKIKMAELTAKGRYTISREMKQNLSDFVAGFATEEEISTEIAMTMEQEGYVLDPHTAVAAQVYHTYQKQTQDPLATVILATASPYKFPRVVVESLRPEQVALTDFELVNKLAEISQIAVPKAVKEIENAAILHDTVIASKDMEVTVEKILDV